MEKRYAEIAQQKLDEYALCTCCEVHQKNRPTRYLPFKGQITDEKKAKTERSCKCDCRHKARLLCRFHHETPYIAPEEAYEALEIIEGEMFSLELQADCAGSFPADVWPAESKL
jgi:hypothetical protein